MQNYARSLEKDQNRLNLRFVFLTFRKINNENKTISSFFALENDYSPDDHPSPLSSLHTLKN